MERIVFWLTRDFGALLGVFPPNLPHRHFTIQITVSDEVFQAHLGGQILESRSLLIASNVDHAIHCASGQRMLVMNVNPLSPLGLWSKQQLKGQAFIEQPNELLLDIWKSAKQLIGEEEAAYKFEQLVQQSLSNATKSEEPFGLDLRIQACLKLLYAAPNPPSATEMAAKLFLSESRFLHLFKSETGLTYRRMILWFRLEKSLRCYQQFNSLTELAHHCGFADSAHYARTFKETFGVKPSALLQKNSRFIQA